MVSCNRFVCLSASVCLHKCMVCGVCFLYVCVCVRKYCDVCVHTRLCMTCEVTNMHATYHTYDCWYVCSFWLCLCCGVSDDDMLILLLLDCSQL